MSLKIVEIILWIILVISLGKIFFIIFSKFPLAANINLEEIPREKTMKTKKQLLKKRLHKTINEQISSLKNKLVTLKNRFRKK